MIATIEFKGKNFKVDLSQPLDISITLRGDDTNPTAWYLGAPTITPHSEGSFIGNVAEGGSVNFNTIQVNPHAHGTHTECIGHITEELYVVSESFDRFFFLCEVLTIAPEKNGADFVISRKQLEYALKNMEREAVVIRTIPNTKDKLSRQYSHKNPPFLLEEAAQFLVEKNIQHLLIDLPSIDKEKDMGALLAHNAFWDTENAPRKMATITEFIYVKNSIPDGTYFLNLQLANIKNDASLSRPVLYKTIP